MKPKLDHVLEAFNIVEGPEKIEGWCQLEKARGLVRLIQLHKPQIIVELGVFGGRSLLPMAAAAEEYGGKVVGIDPWMKGPCLEGSNSPENSKWWAELDLEAVYQSYLHHLNRFGLSNVVTIRDTDEFAVGTFADGSIDFWHSDGNHASEPGFRYMDMWIPKVRPGGIICWDDVNWIEAAEVVARLNRELVLLEDHTTWAVYRKPV